MLVPIGETVRVKLGATWATVTVRKHIGALAVVSVADFGYETVVSLHAETRSAEVVS